MKSSSEIFVLFDVDGVLVKPGGYRKSLNKTITHYLEKMDAMVLLPDDEGISSSYEAIGITNEWDMIVLYLAFIFDHLLCSFDPPEKIDNLSEAIAWCRDLPKGVIEDYQFDSKIQQLKKYIRAGESPPMSILNGELGGEDGRVFKHISKYRVFDDMLRNARDVEKSNTTKVFQHYVIGDRNFEKTYHQSAELHTESFLKLYDIPVLDQNNYKKLMELVANNDLYACVYTARPSLLPIGFQNSHFGFSPEAEIALEILNFDEIPLIAYGRLAYLADLLDTDADNLLKPAIHHSFAALLAAWLGDEQKALENVGIIFKKLDAQIDKKEIGKMLINEFSFPTEIELHIFEDSLNGIKSGMLTTKLLKEFGIDVNFHAWGVTSSIKKIKALSEIGASIYPDINQAFVSFIGS